jgi:integrase
MASIMPYETKNGTKLYRVYYRKPDSNKSASKSGFKRKHDAELWAAKNTVDIATGSFVDPQFGKTRLADLAPVWLAKKKVTLAESYYDDVEDSWHKYVESEWGNSSVGDITRPKVQEWASGLSKEFINSDGEKEPGKSATVVIRAVGVLAQLLDDAKDRKMVVDNAARGIELPKKLPSRHIYLESQQLTKLAKACGEHALLILVLGLVGLRWGEAIGLRVRDVDPSRHRMKIWGSATQVQRHIIDGTTKGKEFRSVVYPAALDAMLSSNMRGKNPDDLLFPGKLEGYMSQPRSDASHRSWWLTGLKKAGLKPMRLHDLRHTAASLMVHSGANVRAVSRQLGHKSVAMTLDIYSDLFDDDLDLVGDAMSKMLEKENVGTDWSRDFTPAA